MTDTTDPFATNPFDPAAFGDHKRRLAAIARTPEQLVIKHCMICDEPLDAAGNCPNASSHLS